MTADPLAMFFTMPITVWRKTADTATGPVFAAPDTTLRGRVRNERKIVRNADGDEIVSEAGVSLPISTPVIPPGSRVELPDGRTGHVEVEAHHETGISFMPNYYSIDLT